MIDKQKYQNGHAWQATTSGGLSGATTSGSLSGVITSGGQSCHFLLSYKTPRPLFHLRYEIVKIN